MGDGGLLVLEQGGGGGGEGEDEPWVKDVTSTSFVQMYIV